MVLLISLCIKQNCSSTLTKFLKPRLIIADLNPKKALYSNFADGFLENLLVEEGNKQKSSLTNYFGNIMKESLIKETLHNLTGHNNKPIQQNSIEDLVNCIEKKIGHENVPKEKLHYLLIYFTKDGNVDGVKAVQSILKKHDIKHYNLQSQYNHYLAEALWICGKIEKSLQLFSLAYDNLVIRPKVKVMLISLFPQLVAQQSEATLHKVIHGIEIFSAQKQDKIILAYLWRELFQSNWFSDQEEADQLLRNNDHILESIHWMIPSMGKEILRKHNIDDYYRLIQFTLKNNIKPMTGLLLRLLFEYYYIHHNIERCTAVVKYSTNLDSPLTEDQHRRYIKLLLQSKNSVFCKLNVKKNQNLTYTF